MELGRLTGGAFAAARSAGTLRLALYPLASVWKYGRSALHRLAQIERTLWSWLRLTWKPVDTEALPAIDPHQYPNRMATLHFEVGLATLSDQHSQSAVLDSKLAVAGGVALTTTALIPPALSAFNLEASEPSVLRWLIVVSALALLFCFANSARGLWPRTYRSLPDLRAIRELLGDDTTEEDARWSVAASLEQAATANERVIAARLATVKLAYSSLILGDGLVSRVRNAL